MSRGLGASRRSRPPSGPGTQRPGREGRAARSRVPLGDCFRRGGLGCACRPRSRLLGSRVPDTGFSERRGHTDVADRAKGPRPAAGHCHPGGTVTFDLRESAGGGAKTPRKAHAAPRYPAAHSSPDTPGLGPCGVARQRQQRRTGLRAGDARARVINRERRDPMGSLKVGALAHPQIKHAHLPAFQTTFPTVKSTE